MRIFSQTAALEKRGAPPESCAIAVVVDWGAKQSKPWGPRAVFDFASRSTLLTMVYASFSGKVEFKMLLPAAGIANLR